MSSVRSWTFAFLLSATGTLCSCSPAPEKINTSQKINAGVEIVPEAVLAAQKVTPSDHAPAADQLDLIDVISDSDQTHYTLIKLLRDADLVPVLQKSGPYTLFAPTDEAFSKLPPGVIDRLDQHHDQLVSFLKYHLLAGRISLKDMIQTNGQVPTLSGPDVIIKGIGDKVMVNDANVLRADSSAANGVVMWVDTVLIK